ncbi:MAG: hypothetical protein HN509_14365 [Halobacteriovoraceae bacterium]|jgi:hypothetical protein|nr:hypothetical protein [Halobacteriovoraceae bacterium]MBT5095372.1 hypothetical protein [Halobacteriovoraceae bacterium]
MQKLALITFLTSFLVFSSLAEVPKQYQATKLFSKEDARKLVDQYYSLHDNRADAREYYPLLADTELHMLMGSVVSSKQEFKSWLRKIKLFSRSVKHTVKEIEISATKNGSYFINLCVRYRGRTRLFTKFDNTDRIKWELVESKDELRLVIQTYLVEKGCK